MEDKFLKYYNNELSLDEQLELFRVIENDEALQRQFVEFQSINALFSLIPQTGDREEGASDYIRFSGLRGKNNYSSKFIRIGLYAASVVLIFSLSWFFAVDFKGVSTDSNLCNTLVVPAGQRAQVILNDGTEVWLNAKSKLIYPSNFNEKERKVILVGEAFFDVAKDASKPFIVSSGEIDIEVLGTKFNIDGYIENGSICTSLLEGSLRVCLAGNKKNSVLLTPNTEVVYMNGKLQVNKIINTDVFKWKEGIYSFENEKFSNILDKLRLYYDVNIVVKDQTILDFEYTGKFKQTDGVDGILKIIQKIHNFKIEREDNTIYLNR